MPGSVVKWEYERREKEILRLYVAERLSVSEIAKLVGISRSRVYAYLERINASRPLTVDAYLTEIIQNGLKTLASLSERFLREAELPYEQLPSVCQRRADTMVFAMLFDRIIPFLRDHYSRIPPDN